VFRTVVARRRPKERATPRRATFVLAAAACLAALVFFWLRPTASGPLALASGEALGIMDASATATSVRLDDGSSIELSAGARVVALENGGTNVLFLVERGRAHFEVRPGGPRRWLVECGLATVEVVGTGFTVDRQADRLRVEVTHGVVLVRGDAVEDRVKRLTDGESIEVVSQRLKAEVAPAAPPAASSPSEPSPSASASSAAVPARPEWRELANRGAYGAAYDLLGARGIRQSASAASIDDLFLLADVARLSGHAGEAVVPLETIVKAHAHDARASLAAFTLGKLYAGGNPAAAAQAFERSLAMGLPASLRGDAKARWADACKRAGDADCEARALGATSATPGPDSP
jgi:transmembrane sensor